MSEPSPEEVHNFLAVALRKWSIYLAENVGAAEAKNMMFAEALSVAQETMTNEEIAVLLRHMAYRVELGGLGEPSIQ